jgi:hypothetical protein
MKIKSLNIMPVRINPIWDRKVDNLDFFKRKFSDISSFKNVYIYRNDIFSDPNEKISRNNSSISF